MTESMTIDCDEALRRLFDYVDAELAEGQRREMERHLDRCRSCFSRYEFERRLKAHLAELGDTEVPPALQQRIARLMDDFTCS